MQGGFNLKLVAHDFYETHPCPDDCPIISLLLLAGTPGLKAANGTWTADADGSWSDTTKWSGGRMHCMFPVKPHRMELGRQR
jgi:hypothetical protein